VRERAVYGKPLLTMLVKKIIVDPRFHADTGYKCPYCNYWSSGRLPRNALSIAVHIYRSHREKVVEILLET